MKQEKKPLTIAVVDDDESILDSVSTVLDDQDWVTRIYASGEAFLSDFKQHKLDCIILDANLPSSSAVTIARAIDQNNSTPIIVLTAYPGGEQTCKIKELGVNSILVKPVTAKVLIKKIQETVNR